MDLHAKLRMLTELAESVGVDVRRAPRGCDPADHPGGALVQLRGRPVVFLDPTASLPDQISVLAEVLRQRREIQDRYLPPEIRETLEGGADSG